MTEKKQQKNINLELREQEAEGIYANLALITHSASEFIIDFARLMPGLPKARIHARIVMTPQNFKNLYRAIGENISRYEAGHGTIPMHGQGIGSVNFEEPIVEDKDKIH
ncbi:MAG: DUF3467 domain-containing protein [Candidatus Glassbacteria bacterium]|nr:DUF3467 domain-containing protein [Candidatus Glassbacteria bacterium]